MGFVKSVIKIDISYTKRKVNQLKILFCTLFLNQKYLEGALSQAVPLGSTWL